MRITRTTIQNIVKEEGGKPFPLVHIMNKEGQFAKTLRSGYEVSFAIEMPFSERRARRVMRQVLTKGNFRLAKITRGDPNPTIIPDSLGHFLHVSFTVEDASKVGNLEALDPKDHRAGFTLRTKWTPPLPQEVKADIWGPSNERIGWIDLNGEAHYDGFDGKSSDSPLILTREERRILKAEIALRHALASLPAIVANIDVTDAGISPISIDAVEFRLINSGFDDWTYASVDALLAELGWTLYFAEPDGEGTIFEADRLKPGPISS